MQESKSIVTSKDLPLLGMSCSACAMSAEKIIKRQTGVIDASVNLVSQEISIKYDSSVATLEEFKNALSAGGYELLIENQENEPENIEALKDNALKKHWTKTLLSILFTTPIVLLGMLFMDAPYANEIMMILCTPMIFWIGKDFYINAWRQAIIKTMNMDTLVALSTGIAYVFSSFNTLYPHFLQSKGLEVHVYFEAAAVIITFILLGKYLEERAKNSTSSAIKKLMGLQPQNVITISDEGSEKIKKITEIQIDEKLLIKPGNRIPVDGIVHKGETYIDESMISGEPIPVLKEKGSKVLAGTTNLKGSIIVTARQVGENTVLAQIIELVKKAQSSKAPVQKLVDKIASIFVPTIITIAIITFCAWMLFGIENALSHAITSSITVLIIACPCALGLATPTALMVGIGKAAEKGILIKDAQSLELFKKINTIILDKTGTITEGHPQVQNELWEKNDKYLIDILYSLEKLSEHPLADSITQHFEREAKMLSVDHFQSITGIGVMGYINGEKYTVGQMAFPNSAQPFLSDNLSHTADAWKKQAQTVVYFSNSREVLAIIGIADKVKGTSFKAIQQLKLIGIEVHMLTGDNAHAARAISEQMQIDVYKAEMTPQQKAEYISELQSAGKIVAMIGDGINDTAALAAADVSIAMGHGSDIAMDVSKMTIISSDLIKIPEAISISKSTVKTIQQNLFWAFIYNVIGIPIAAGILYPLNGFLLNPMIAGAAMAFSSISVLLNSLRLKRL